MARARSGWALALAALVACESGGAADAVEERAPATEAAGEAALITSFNVSVGADTVRFSLRVSNAATEPVALDFATGQRFDFEVHDSEGQTVWRWSGDRMFTQAMASDTLAPGEVRSYEASWVPAAVATGEYEAAAQLLAVQKAVELVTVFELRDP